MAYSANYGAFDFPRTQPVPVRMFTDETHPLPEYSAPRMAAKWWKLHPEAACPEADVSVWLDANLDIMRGDFLALCVAELGDDDAVFLPHPWNDCIYPEARDSLRGAKYDGMPIVEQAEHYRALGHPEHWGLFHASILIRRHNAAVRAFDEAWWHENVVWSLQDQVSLSPVLRTSELRWHVMTKRPHDLGWVKLTMHHGADVWR